jgi:outer membrane receptor protein involved in Fe transport
MAYGGVTRFALAFTTVFAGAVPGWAQTTAETDRPDLLSNDIVVTASRRDERLQDVPAAVTALSGDTLETLGVRSFSDYVSLVPGLSQRDVGNPGQGTFIIRGLNTGSQSITNTSAVYLDDTPFSASGFLSAGALLTPDPDIADVERIEVLKGPQGTLYGANSLGGLIRIVSARPDSSGFSGRVQADVTALDGGDVGWSTRASVNVPIVTDKLAVRVNGVYRVAPGWTDNVQLGTENVNESIIKGGKLAVRFTPVDDLVIDLSGTIQTIENKGVARQDNKTLTLVPRDGRYQYRAAQDERGKLEYRLYSGSADYDFGGASLIATVSYGEYRTDLFSDVTEGYVPFLRAIGFGGIIPADAQATGDFSPNMDKFTAEVRLVSERLGRFEFLAGLFYTDESNTYRANLFIADGAGAPLAAPFDVLVRTTTSSDYKELAGYGNLTFYLTDNFDVTGGIRVARNEQQAQTGGPNSVVFYRPRAIADFEFKDTVTTWLGTVRWRPTSDISTFLRAASGFRPGGPQNNPAPPPGAQTTIRPDSVWNYEAGVRATVLDGTFNINASVYRIDWTDIQLQGLFNNIVLQANGGAARVDGAEMEVVARPVTGLTLAANAGYTNARITEVDAGVSANIGAVAGDRLPLTPEFTMALIGDYRLPLANGNELNFGSTLRFRSDMPSSYSNTVLNPNMKVPSATTLDLRAGINLSGFEVQARVENLFNALIINTLATNFLSPAFPVPTSAFVGRPRAFTFAVAKRF